MSEIFYTCPHCRAQLNLKDAVILLARHDEEEHLVGLHPEPGNYEIYLPADTEPTPGDRWDYLCPVCRTDLATEFSEFLCAVDMEGADEAHRVFFSRLAGEQATFVVSNRGAAVAHGRDADRYRRQAAQMKYIL